jgi:rhodanese-related sulfurtransferase
MSRLLTLSLFCLLPLALMGADTKDADTESLETIQERIENEEAVLLDVRNQGEWDQGHVEGALWIALPEFRKLNKEKLTKMLPEKKIVYCYCAAGKRAGIAADQLKKMGFDARKIKAGYQDLIKAGFVESKAPAATP